jgi:hypothetical protein
VLGGIVLVTAAGVRFEGGAEAAGLPALLLLHGWILATFTIALAVRQPVAARLGENLSWVLAFAGLVVSGLVSDVLF